MMSDLVGKSQQNEKTGIDIHFDRQIKVVHLSTQDFGGAGKAAYRLHKGLQSIGIDSNMIVLNKGSGDPSVRVLPNNYSESMASCLDVQAYNSPIWDGQNGRWLNPLATPSQVRILHPPLAIYCRLGVY